MANNDGVGQDRASFLLNGQDREIFFFKQASNGKFINIACPNLPTDGTIFPFTTRDCTVCQPSSSQLNLSIKIHEGKML